MLATALFWAALCCAARTSAQAPLGRPIGLDEAYRLALARSETLAQSADAARAALAQVRQLKSAILPQISLGATELLQENPNSGLSEVDKTSLFAAQITLQQPLFTGFREFLAFRQGKLQAESALQTEKRVEQLLLQDVAQAYYALLSVQRQIDIQRSVIRTYEDRIRQLSAWAGIGRSRDSEVLAARSQLAQAQATLELDLGQEDVDQEALRFLTGLEDRLLPETTPLPALEALEPLLQRAEHRSDVESARQSLEAARLNTQSLGRQRWPMVNLTADYYLRRYSFDTNIHYDAQFAASLPLFDWGKISAQVSQARAQEHSGQEALTLAQRGAQRDVRTAYRTLQWALDAWQALSKAADLAQSNVEAQTRDYRRALVTNIDVLNSINGAQSTLTVLEQTRWNAAFARVKLDVAAGSLEPPR